jgi:hypothetical protein
MIESSSPPDAARLISDARDRAGALISTLANLRGEPLDVAQVRAAASVKQYSDQLLDELLASVAPYPSAEWTAWVKTQYTDLAMAFAKSVCQIESDAGRRHAVAQAVQYQILASERRLRSAFDAGE